MSKWESSVAAAPGLAATLCGGGAGGGGGACGSSSGGGSDSRDLLELSPLMPGGGCCSCGHPYTPHKAGLATVYDPDTIGPKQARLFELRSGCGRAGCVVVYDGVQDGLFRYSRMSFFSLRHMYNYAEGLQSTGLNVEAYVKQQHRLVASTLPRDEQRPPQFSTSLFRLAWRV